VAEIGEHCRPPDRVPIYGWVSMEKWEGITRLQCLVTRWDVRRFQQHGWRLREPEQQRHRCDSETHEDEVA